jgi:hypothetical protein
MPLVSERAKGTGYYGSVKGLHTIQYSTANNFIGNIKMQATLVKEPAETDWFDIRVFADLTNGLLPVPNGSIIKNFAGNFVWARAVITTFTNGDVNRVLFTHN